MHLPTLLFSLLLPLLTLSTPTPQRLPPTPVSPPPSAVSVIGTPIVDTSGSGCRPGTVGVAFSSNNTIFTFIFDDFQAAIGPKAGEYSKRALCKVNVTIASPGWAFDVESVDFRGFVGLDKGVDASLVSRWKWVDVKSGVDIKGKGNIQKKLSGPFEDDFLIHKDGEVSDTQQVDCAKESARFQITISASLEAADAMVNGFVKGDSVDAKFAEMLNLKWRKC
ncbi:hypothetical protein M011DRAFT_490635 [Sporormia fimetaria CBS 119925]|uniref:Secreted protein n=1 Tax=Sporormia fimetaria CBS 119925 TaxID=1340428 RepID=A0A6A6UZP4_9PLEO|nr:hypothetical protein M011DRAFT_490635 [Sporormia fimetaria CBS 119925]